MNEEFEQDEVVNGWDSRLPKRINRRASLIGALAVGAVAAAGAALYIENSAGAAPTGSAGSSASASSGSTGSPAPSSATPSSSPTCAAQGGGQGFGGRGPGQFGHGAEGKITAVSPTSLTVRDLFGASHTFKLTSSTLVRSDPARSAKLGDLKVGANAAVRTAGSTSTATEVLLRAARIDGSVKSVTSSEITVTDRDGFTRTIDTDSATTYSLNSASTNRTKVTVGSVVHAEGKVDSNGTTLDAAKVTVVTSGWTRGAGPNACGPWHGHGRGGRWSGPSQPGSPSGSTTPTPPTPSATTTS